MNEIQGTYIKELADFHGSVGELLSIVKKLEAEYGPKTYIRFEAGYNNIECMVVTEADIESYEKYKKVHEELSYKT